MGMRGKGVFMGGARSLEVSVWGDLEGIFSVSCQFILRFVSKKGLTLYFLRGAVN